MKKYLIFTLIALVLFLISSEVKAQTFEDLSKTAQGISLLNWNWHEGANMSDNGTGRPLRN